ncbi:DUF1189 domain-containing protein [Acholeplasma vituli]|uniref:DUF1189 domain-containing protein n=1 Tax=Paracholeplasma vituli TaxID=69473 RepID=A0ABT2PU86_9MOLU|nr:DUF1189 domain-containing protein [Paracholeplasma vituli]MCU0104487.1 DUF1189 domain-containing protein [Paracholeplasma vituli]
MLKRIQISVFQPSKIAFFLKDKMGYVFLYMALLAFIASLPIIIKSYVLSPFTPEVEQELIGLFIQKAPDCAITNGEMTCVTTDGFTYKDMRIHFNEPYDTFETQLVFEKTGLGFYANRTQIESLTYLELGMENFDFDLTETKDIETFKTALVKLDANYRSFYATGFSLGIFISNFVLYLAIAGIMALSYGVRLQKLNYRYRFIMAAYASTVYFIIALIAELYGLGILMLVGMILPFVMMAMAFNGLIRMSKVVIRKKDDEE